MVLLVFDPYHKKTHVRKVMNTNGVSGAKGAFNVNRFSKKMQGFTGLGPESLGFTSFNGVILCQLHSRNAIILRERMLSNARNFAGDDILGLLTWPT